MEDKKKLNAEEPKQIRQGDIDAWKRGKDDAKRNQLLKKVGSVTTDKAVAIVKLFATCGDEQFVRQKLSVSISDIRKCLEHFNIKSIEDAKALVNKGIIAQLDAAKAQEREEAATQSTADHAEKSEKLVEHNKKFGDKPKISDHEKDLKLREAREEAFRKNKSEKIKELISQGIKTQHNGFKVGLADVAAFVSMIPYGVNQLQRRFGGSKKDIVAEIKRLAPNTDIDMLRP